MVAITCKKCGCTDDESFLGGTSYTRTILRARGIVYRSNICLMCKQEEQDRM